MELRELLIILRRRLSMLLLMPAVAGLTAAALSFYVLTPVYEASTTLWVVKTDGAALDYTTLMFNRNLTKTYGEVAQSRAVAEQVRQRLRLVDDVEALQRRITVTPVRDTEIIAITVEDRSPAQATAIANTLAAVFSEEIAKFIKLDNVRVVDRATVPLEPVRPRPLLNTAIALVLGAMAAVGLAFLLEQIDVRIRTPDDVERHLGLPVVGLIPLLESAPGDEGAAHPKARATLPTISGGEG